MDLRYPIGKFEPVSDPSADQRRAWIAEIEHTPAAFRRAVEGLSPAQLDTPYRPEGWTVRQLAHHLPDSHMNAYVRFKLALTEDVPTIKPYLEARWAELGDSAATPVEVSLALLDALHQRWVVLLGGLSDADFARRFRHPEHGRELALGTVLGLYAWHSKHHVAHITALRAREGW